MLVGVLALALLVALLPRTDNVPGEEQASEQDLGPARAQAALQACPDPGQPPVERLAGVEATCLADGSPVDLGAALGGGPTLINFWATWCEPCRDELPLLEAYAAEPDSVPVLTVQVESSQEDGLGMLADLDVHLPGVHDGSGRSGPVRAALQVPRALPASYLVQADGSVHLVENPRLFTSLDQIRNAVKHAL